LLRSAVIVVAALSCCGPAAASPPHGSAIVPAPLPSPRSLHQLDLYPRALIELDRVRGPAFSGALRRAGAELISPPLQIWRLPTAQARRLLPQLVRAGAARSVQPDLPLDSSLWSSLGLSSLLADPLASTEWWIPHIGADRWNPPGPGVPLTVIDSGVDLMHDEFRGRPNTFAMNKQLFLEDESELHGTAVASVAAAPVNGRGLVGVYPRARLRSWDISPRGIPTIGDELAALAAVTARGRGVVNISFGGATYFASEQHAILTAFAGGSLIVAASGNYREILSPLEYPANFSHVLTVGATDQNDEVTVFSSATPKLDLAAPGLEIPVAAPLSLVPGGYLALSGTSFSTPLVAGAAAAVWTRRPTLEKTQLFDVMRLSARDVGDPGRDPDTGFGVLNIPAALRRPARPVDPQEPNEDIYLVKPNGISRNGHAPLTWPARRQASVSARLDATEDPVDVYRVWLPERGRLVAGVKATDDLTIDAWGPETGTVFTGGKARLRHLLKTTTVLAGSKEGLSLRGRLPGRYVYLSIYLTDKELPSGSYTLTLETVRR
jgi:Subtilase family